MRSITDRVESKEVQLELHNRACGHKRHEENCLRSANADVNNSKTKSRLFKINVPDIWNGLKIQLGWISRRVVVHLMNPTLTEHRSASNLT
jgi:hypothetical protein